MAGNIAGAIFGALEGLGKGISNSANTAKETGSGNRNVGSDTTTNANGGENAATGGFRGYTNGMSDQAGLTGSEKNNENNLYGNNSSASSSSESSNPLSGGKEEGKGSKGQDLISQLGIGKASGNGETKLNYDIGGGK